MSAFILLRYRWNDLAFNKTIISSHLLLLLLKLDKQIRMTSCVCGCANNNKKQINLPFFAMKKALDYELAGYHTHTSFAPNFTARILQSLGGSPGLVVMGGDSCSKGHWFESQRPILDGHFFTFICYKNCNVCLKRRK